MRLDPGLLPASIPEGVYDPREDSLLLIDAIGLQEGWGTALEVGCGAGLLSLHLAKAGMAVTAVDVNREALAHLRSEAVKRRLAIDVRESDLFARIEGRYDLVAFNPPYLPAGEGDGSLTEDDRRALVGGKEGFEVALRFACAVRGHIAESGAAYLLLLEEHGDMLEGCRSGMRWTKVKSADFGGERLAVFIGVPKEINSS